MKKPDVLTPEEYEALVIEVVAENKEFFQELANIGGRYIREVRLDKLHILTAAIPDGLRSLNEKAKTHVGIGAERKN